jgi:uncharacterized coiled-coil protein SlyX
VSPPPETGFEQRLDALEMRTAELEESLDRLAARIEQAVARLAALAQAVSGVETHTQHGSAAGAPVMPPSAPPSDTPRISSEMAQVIRLVQAGRGEEAQRLLRSLPEDQLAGQPGVVALVAAALCAQRGDYATGLKALESARAVTGDPRLLRLMQLMQEQLE